MKKDLLIIGGLFTLIIVLLVVGSYLNIFLGNLAPQAAASTQVRINSLVIAAEVAKTTQTRSQGLSKRESLAPNTGMLFVFEKVDRYNFWMKDVKFPIDIIWIGQDKRIADITRSAQPEPGVTDNLLRIYQPAVSVLYVLEVAEGTAAFNNLRIGDQAEFSL